MKYWMIVKSGINRKKIRTFMTIFSTLFSLINNDSFSTLSTLAFNDKGTFCPT